jgi:hypothetical protein
MTAIKYFESHRFFWVDRLMANKQYFNLGLNCDKFLKYCYFCTMYICNKCFLLCDSNINVTVSALSLAFIVITSSFPAHFKILDILKKTIKNQPHCTAMYILICLFIKHNSYKSRLFQTTT